MSVGNVPVNQGKESTMVQQSPDDDGVGGGVTVYFLDLSNQEFHAL